LAARRPNEGMNARPMFNAPLDDRPALAPGGLVEIK
jgi:hypothetical protein